jgi:hypothetical protein
MNVSELDDAISAALMALSAAQLTLRKGASPRELDILQKAFLGDDPRASTSKPLSVDAIIKANAAFDAQMESMSATLDEIRKGLDALEAGRDADSQARKTYTITRGQS